MDLVYQKFGRDPRRERAWVGHSLRESCDVPAVKEARPRLLQQPFRCDGIECQTPKVSGCLRRVDEKSMGGWSLLTATVRSGRPVDHDEPEAPGYRHQFT